MATVSGGPIRVLIVDDNPRFGELAEMFLEEEFEDIRVDAATSAVEGEQTLAEKPVDCIVSDYQMPEKDGIEFLRDVRTDHPQLPFIIMTGKGDETVASEAISAGVTDYIRKEAGSEHYDLLAHRIRNAVGQRRTEQAKKARNRRIRRVYERIDDGFVALDEQWQLTYANTRAAELLDRSNEELRGKEVTEVFPGIEDTEFYRAASGVLDEQEVISVEEHYDLLDAWLEVRIFPDVDGLSIYFRDVTERKRRQQELERSRKRYRALVDTAPTAIVVTDAEDGEIVEINQSAESLLGRSSETLSGEHHTALHPSEDRKLYETLFRERLETGAGMVSKHADGSQVYVVTDDGERIPVEISSQVIDLENERLVQSVIRDVVKRS
ncbi:PAS domain S-box-containing protein [Natronoarchaeum philippinense]|uniref:PAS domain S-box-containing protein n=1 Tax=Natronoarchaeum philippinense TaxID=558529 RepID=A0A285P7F8_NATPI|nr:PAS domain S-box protein [Natronoarchaeum philippinense]SNZ17378.1 PAS domain S-box-containing protein [Natronoarchaeum philippinense]